MRRLAFLAFVALAAFPLSAHDHWREPRRVVVFTEPRFVPCRPWEGRRWDVCRNHYAVWPRGCADARLVLRPIPPPFRARVDHPFH